ncbi:alpha/beta fold hydrolase [candidate division KSB1 bacterium]|nr:alpha/beta fold hydrolase [candidate division KSB1 bacterium]
MSKKAVVTEQPVTFISKDSQLVGILHSSSSDKIIIMCHGFKGDKIENKRLFVEAARTFTRENYDVLRFDFYGSGDSEGEFEDTLISTNIANLTDAVQFVKEKGYKHIAVLGISMGAAAVILTVNKLDVEAVILWSAVPDMKTVFAANIKSMGDFDPDKIVYEYEGWSIKRYFWEDAVQYNIKEQLARIKVPKLIIQGTADDPVFVQGFYEFREIVLPPADFMEMPNAGHTYQTPGHRLKVIRQTLIWLNRHF